MTVLAAVLGLITGLVVAHSPVANGTVLLLGVAVGVVATVATQAQTAEHRHTKEARPRLAADERAPRDLTITKGA